jgi:hypothetical protein
MPVVYGKLVRDLIPEIIQSESRRPVTRVLDEASYRQALLAKLIEEAFEATELTKPVMSRRRERLMPPPRSGSRVQRRVARTEAAIEDAFVQLVLEQRYKRVAWKTSPAGLTWRGPPSTPTIPTKRPRSSRSLTGSSRT